jgi:hypothetical protein
LEAMVSKKNRRLYQLLFLSIYELNPQTCISLIDCMPAFRCRKLEYTDPDKMEKVHQLLSFLFVEETYRKLLMIIVVVC